MDTNDLITNAWQTVFFSPSFISRLCAITPQERQFGVALKKQIKHSLLQFLRLCFCFCFHHFPVKENTYMLTDVFIMFVFCVLLVLAYAFSRWSAGEPVFTKGFFNKFKGGSIEKGSGNSGSRNTKN